MPQFLPNAITPEELAALRLIAHGPTDAATRDRLLILGYARVVLGGLALTNEGFLQIAASERGKGPKDE
jgi:hypothetical protein